MESDNLLPHDNNDLAAIEKIKTLSAAQLVPLADQLLSYMQDGHWSVAPEIGEILAKHLSVIEKPIIAILNGNDNGWKFYVLMMLIQKADSSLITPSLQEVIRRIANSPTSGEKAENVDEEAQDILSRIGEH
jgi:hypothetical protein